MQHDRSNLHQSSESTVEVTSRPKLTMRIQRGRLDADILSGERQETMSCSSTGLSELEQQVQQGDRLDGTS